MINYSGSLFSLEVADRAILIDLARQAVAHRVEFRSMLPIDVESVPERLRIPRATFVTLRTASELRGCIGTTTPVKPLAVDVVYNAFRASYSDLRFAAIVRSDLARLEVSISVLSALEELSFQSEAELLSLLCPERDGLLLQETFTQATFLPVMWERLPKREQFWSQLKEKAGLPPEYWSSTLRVFRYCTETVE